MSASPINGSPVVFKAVGYTKGNTGSYAGITVTSSPNATGAPVSQLFHSGTFATDMLMAQVAARGAIFGNKSGGFSAGWTIDKTIDNYISDVVAAQ